MKVILLVLSFLSFRDCFADKRPEQGNSRKLQLTKISVDFSIDHGRGSSVDLCETVLLHNEDQDSGRLESFDKPEEYLGF